MNRSRSLASCCLAGLLLLGVVFAAVGPVAGTPAAAAQDEEGFPRAEAGLDQTVQQNASVLLDATESWSPNGELVAYEWEITSPNGSTIDPQCDSVDCGRGRFRAPELGEYTVTVTIEDVDGRRESDTMYVTVVPRGDFGVELTGPSDAVGEEANLTATVAPGDVQVQNLTWYRGDQELENHSVPVTGGVFERSTFIAPGSTYRAVATDQFGRTVNDSWSPSGGSTWTPDGPDSDEYPRIAGPSLVTGSYDYVDDGTWQFEGMNYNVYTSKYGSVADVTWGLNNGNSKDFNAHGTQLEPALDPGVNTIVANLDIELEKLKRADHAANNTDSNLDVINGTTSREVVLRRRVVVDPEPVITSSTIHTEGRQLSVKYGTEDQFKSPESVRISIDGTTVVDDDISNVGDYIERPIPDDIHGDVTARLYIKDSRGQVATRSKRVTAEVPPSEIRIGIVHPSTNDDADDGGGDDGEDDDSSHTSPVLVPWP